MEAFVLFLILLLILWLRNSLTSELRKLSNEIKNLRSFIQQKEQERKTDEFQWSAPPQKPKEDVPPPPKETGPPPPSFIMEEIITEEKPEPVKTDAPPPSPIETFEENQKAEIPADEIKHETVFEKKTSPVSQPQPSFFERHPDLEKFIGENLINKIGIAILVLGIGFFVKYAIDKNWINEIGRVFIGILAGGILIGIAHRMRKTFKAFSSVLIGGGLSVLYFTIAIAFHEYHIFSQAAAFVIMIIITGFAVALSIAYDRIELAVLALIGGFTTPFMISTGEGNYKVLFTYLLILNCGMLVLAYRKKWNLVNILCYTFTVFIYGSWLVTKCLGFTNAPYLGALIFGTAFYIVFFLMNIIYNIKNNNAFKAFEIGMLLSNTFLYYAAGLSILYYYHQKDFQGLFTALMGVFNFGFAFAFYKKQKVDRNLIFLLIGLVLTFISLAAPIQLEGNHITLFWSAEAVLLLWLSQKSGITLIKGTSVLVVVLMLMSLFMDWDKLYGYITTPSLNLFLNKAFITSVVSLISVALTLRLLKNEKEEFFIVKNFKLTVYQTILQVVFVSLLFLTFHLEINYQLISRGYNYSTRYVSLGLYNFSFLSIAYFIYRTRLTRTLSVTFMAASGFALLIYMSLYNISIINVRRSYLEENIHGLFFMLHFLLAGLFAYAIYIFNQTSKKTFSRAGDNHWIKWVTVFLIVYICSAELNHIVAWISYSPGRIIYLINKQVCKTGYSVLWGIISFILMQQGMKRKDRMVRIISLSLFFITIIKLFAWDIQGISEGGKIIAFISLGILLLVVSFMYQRLKKLILENDAADKKSKDENQP
jgi:uncharacterized membrane protein